MLKQPGAHDVGGDLRKDAAFLLPLSGAIGLRVLVGSAVTRPDTVVQSVACTTAHDSSQSQQQNHLVDK